MTDENNIDKALKRLEGSELRVCIRGGRVVKIPQQTIELQSKDGIQTIYKIAEDII